jgi:pyruvate,water dikinase
VPNGFATTAEAFRLFLAENGLDKRIGEALSQLDVADTKALQRTGAAIRGWVVDATLPAALRDEIASAYAELASLEGSPELAVAVRSSATAEDLPDASFAGQQETYLNVEGVDTLLRTVKRVFASLYTNRAISVRDAVPVLQPACAC